MKYFKMLIDLYCLKRQARLNTKQMRALQEKKIEENAALCMGTFCLL